VSSIDLVLLGLLARENLSAYDLAKHIQTYDLGDVIRLSIPAIYKNVKILQERECLAAEAVRLGEMPEKTIYSLTDKGREYFYALMEKYAGQKVSYRFDFNSVVMNLDRVPKRRRERLLRRLREKVKTSGEEIAVFLNAWKKESSAAELILAQVELVNRALLEWIDGILRKV
jgi:DNA-binding PadR family transcriptional regulator